jgi:acyl carrier protein
MNQQNKEPKLTVEKIIQRLNTIFIEVLDDKNISLTPETTASDIEEWDSLTHIQLVTETEKCFAIKFTAAEIRNLQKIEDYCQTILNKLSDL